MKIQYHIIILIVIAITLPVFSQHETNPNINKARLTGRFDHSDPKGPIFGWSGSSIKIKFTGTDLKVKLAPLSKSQTENWLEIIIDGKVTGTLRIEKEDWYTAASGLTQKTHVVELYKRTEGFLGELQLSGIESGEGGILHDPPQPAPRSIEFIGDSNTCAYGNEAKSKDDRFHHSTENNYMAYSSIAARNLNADHVTVAWSGQGIYRDYNGNTYTPMPERYTRTLPTKTESTWDFSHRQPDIVVINLGANDFASGSPPKKTFVNAYLAFLKTIRKNYPDAYIYCAMGPSFWDERLETCRSYMQTIIKKQKRKGDKKIGFIEFPTQKASDGYGADWHPSIKTHQKMADRLTKKIKEDFGW